MTKGLNYFSAYCDKNTLTETIQGKKGLVGSQFKGAVDYGWDGKAAGALSCYSCSIDSFFLCISGPEPRDWVAYF